MSVNITSYEWFVLFRQLSLGRLKTMCPLIDKDNASLQARVDKKVVLEFTKRRKLYKKMILLKRKESGFVVKLNV